MSTLMTRMFKDRCTACQVGQGRNCSCRTKRKPRGPRLTDAEWIALISTASVIASLGSIWALWRWLA